jgi:hypothetical protein
MRITRSGLRRIIAEESARILAETKKRDPRHFSKGTGEPHRDGDGDDVQSAIDTLMDTGEDPFPFGEPAEDDEDWAEEQLQGVMDMYGDPNPYGDDEAAMGDLEYDGAGGWKKPGLKEGEGKKRHQSPRDRLAAYLDRVGADSAAIMRAVDRAVDRAHEEGSEVTSEDITFNLSDEVLDAIPEDDSDRWHSMLDAVLADEIDPEAFADAERDRQDIEDTERDLSHPSRFLEEGDDDALDEYGNPDDSDPDGGYVGFMASDDEMNYLRGGGSYSNSPYADLDVPDNRYTRGRAKGFGKEPRVRGDDIDSGYDDADDMGDNLAEGEGDSDGPDQYDPDDAEFHADNEREYQNARRFWSDEGGSSLKASHSDFDDVRGSAGPVKRFITRGRQGKPHRVSDDGLDIDSGDEDLSESRWAKLAGILKG